MTIMRLNKLIAHLGYCSRREADRLITDGRVFVNNVRAKLGDQATEEDTIRVDGRSRTVYKEYQYVLFNKPVGKLDQVLPADFPRRMYCILPLPDAYAGLEIFSDHPDMPFKNTTRLECEYVIDVDTPLKAVDSGKLRTSYKTRQISPYRFAMILDSGEPRQAITLIKKLGYNPIRIQRTRIGDVKIPTNYPLEFGRALTESETESFLKSFKKRRVDDTGTTKQKRQP